MAMRWPRQLNLALTRPDDLLKHWMKVDRTNRREFITLLGGAAAWPFAARAEHHALRLIGYLQSAGPASSASYLAALRRGLSETGYVEG